MEWVLIMAALFVASVAGSYAVQLIITRRQAQHPPIGTTLRIRAHAGVYRSKLLSIEGDLWRMSYPLQRNQFVPMREGEPVTIEAPTTSGVYLFKTQVLLRDDDRQECAFLAPALARPTERRQDPRRMRSDDVTLDDAPARLVNISRNGAQLKSSRRVRLGDRVKLILPEGMIVAWVIDTMSTRPNDAFSDTVRVRFETPLT